jgi:hypothetical protein
VVDEPVGGGAVFAEDFPLGSMTASRIPTGGAPASVGGFDGAPSDQVDGLTRLVEDALDSLRQVLCALQALKTRLDGDGADPS